jgi:hypothetical protein
MGAEKSARDVANIAGWFDLDPDARQILERRESHHCLLLEQLLVFGARSPIRIRQP